MSHIHMSVSHMYMNIYIYMCIYTYIKRAIIRCACLFYHVPSDDEYFITSSVHVDTHMASTYASVHHHILKPSHILFICTHTYIYIYMCIYRVSILYKDSILMSTSSCT